MKFQESFELLEKRFKKIEYEANVRYNRQMMSQEEEDSEFWHYQQDFETESKLNIHVKHNSKNSNEELRDYYELEILGTYEGVEEPFSRIYYIVRVLDSDANGKHDTIFDVDEQLACYYGSTPRISRTCDQFSNPSYEFEIGGRSGVINYGKSLLAKDVPYLQRLVDQIGSD